MCACIFVGDDENVSFSAQHGGSPTTTFRMYEKYDNGDVGDHFGAVASLPRTPTTSSSHLKWGSLARLCVTL
jgi:hypothetical protein